jgi:hypothetical protein
VTRHDHVYLCNIKDCSNAKQLFILCYSATEAGGATHLGLHNVSHVLLPFTLTLSVTYYQYRLAASFFLSFIHSGQCLLQGVCCLCGCVLKAVKSVRSKHVIRSRTKEWTVHMAHGGKMRHSYRILIGKSEGKISPGKTRHRWIGFLKFNIIK